MKLGQGNIFRSVCQEFCLWGDGIPPCLAGGIPACLGGFQGWYPSMSCRSPAPHPWDSSMRGLARGSPGTTPRWRMRGLVRGVSRPTPRGGFSRPTPRRVSPGPHPGGCLQAHTQEGVSRPTPRGCLQAHTQEGVSRPTPRGSPGPHQAEYPSMC